MITSISGFIARSPGFARRVGFGLSVLLTTSSVADVPADGCPPPLPVEAAEARLLGPAQEVALGDVAHDALLGLSRTIDDDALTEPLQRIGEVLLRELPPSPLRFRFWLSDMPVVNAFTLPGGRIYVTRKLVAAVRSEDELAGVVAHELGHGLRRDGTAGFVRRLRRILRSDALGDREDVFEKFHRLIDSGALHPAPDDQHGQVAADAMAIFALARAGYRPEAYADLWDRVQGTRGRKGNWLSDLFGATPPEVRRLREMLRTQAALPGACRAAPRPADPAPAAAFRSWQDRVVAYDGWSRTESLPGLVWKRVLEPPLQPDIRHVRFSPDGRFVLAQDDAAVFVFSREPFALRFTIEADEAEPAQFSPDSSEVVFNTAALRVERWALATGERLAVDELARRTPCLTTALSPDGRFLACFDAERQLSLIEVDTAAEVFVKRSFFTPKLGAWRDILAAAMVEAATEGDVSAPEMAQLAFSPDGRYFVGGALRTTPVAFDLRHRVAIELPAALHKLTQRSFTFVGPDRLAGLHPDDAAKSAVVSFPSGAPLVRLPLSAASRLAVSASGERLLMRPLHAHPVAAMNLATQRVFFANRRGPALDFDGDVFVNEAGDGTLEMGRIGSEVTERIASATLPRGRLGRLRAAALSTDLAWLAVSQRHRGAAWALERGERTLHLRGFLGADLDDHGLLHADFPALSERGRAMARISVAQGAALDERPIGGAGLTSQTGRLLVVRRLDTPNEWWRRVTVDAHDARSLSLLWSRRFAEEAPVLHVAPDGSSVTMAWGLPAAAASRAASDDPGLRRLLASLKEKEGDYLVEVVEARTGTTMGRLVIETGLGSFRIERALAAGDWLALDDNRRRVLLYSLKTGELRGRTFGDGVAISAAAGLLAVEASPGRLAIHDLEGMDKRIDIALAHPLAMARFTQDGRRLFVLTSDQTAYLFDTGQP